MELPPEKWEKVKALFEAALEQTPEARPAFLAERCPDEDVRREVERLLQNRREMGSFLTEAVLSDRTVSQGSPVPTTFSVGDVVASRFKVRRFIARGGMGEVYAAEDLQLAGEVALKTIRPEMLRERGSVERFKREVQLAKQVTHPNVCRIYDLFVSSSAERTGAGSSGEGLFFVSMELLRGETLAQRLKRSGRITETEALPIAIQVASGVGAAHQAGVLHRDLKPGNILLVPSKGPEGVRAVVTDFGLARSSAVDAKLAATSISQLSVWGTPAYMSPEQLEGKQLAPTSDVYALGLLMYEIATGSPAFPTRFRDLSDIPRAPRSLAPGLSRGWEAVILKCLEPEPPRRFQSAAEVKEALTGETHVVPRRLPRVVLVALSILAVLAALATLGWMSARLRTSLRKATTETRISPPNRRSVAVLGFKNATGRRDAAWISTVLSEMLTTELAAGGQLRTIPEESVTRTKADLSLADADSLAQETLTRVYKNRGSDFVVLGSYTALGETSERRIRLDLRVENTRAGEPITSVAETGTESELFELVSRAGGRLREKLGLEEVSASDSQGVRASLPSNPRAAKLYSEGLAKLHRFDALAARDILERAVAEDPKSPLALLALADAWSALGYDEKAKQEAKLAFEASASLSQELRLWVEGQFREMSKDWELASGIYRNLWNFYPDDLEYGLRLADAQSSAGKGKEALVTVEALRRLPPPSRDDPRIDLAQARAAQTLGNFKLERDTAATAARKAQALGARLFAARARLQEGGASQDLGDLKNAAELFAEASVLYRTVGDAGGVARALYNGGNVLVHQGDLVRARHLYEESLIYSRETHNQNSTASALNGIGIILYRQGKLAAASRLFEQCVTAFREVGNKGSAATALNNIAQVLADEADLPGARTKLEQALGLTREIGDKGSTARTLFNLGELLERHGDLTAAKRSFEESLAIGREIDDKEESAYALYGLGDVLFARGDLTQAKTKHEQALALRAAMGEKGTVAESRLALAELLCEQGDPGEAERQVREAMEQFRAEDNGDEEALAYAVLARSFLAQGRKAESRHAAERADELAAKSEDHGVRLFVALDSARVLAAHGKSGEAQGRLRSALAEATRLHYCDYELKAHLALGEIETDFGDTAAGHGRLEALEKDAQAKGFGLIGRKAAADLATRSPGR